MKIGFKSKLGLCTEVTNMLNVNLLRRTDALQMESHMLSLFALFIQYLSCIVAYSLSLHNL